MRIGLFALGFICCLVLDCLVLELQAETAVLPELSPAQQQRVELLQLQLEIMPVTKTIEKEEQQLAKKIAVYEELVTIYCMPKLAETLNYEPGPLNQPCQEYLAAVERLDAANAVVLCIRHGIDSPECETAYDEKIIAPPPTTRDSGSTIDWSMPVKLHAMNLGDQWTDLRGEYWTNKRTWREASGFQYTDPEEAARLRPILMTQIEEMLKLACAESREEALLNPPAGARRAGEFRGQGDKSSTTARPAHLGVDPLEKLIEEFSSRVAGTKSESAAETATPEPAPLKVSRVRVLARECIEAIQEALAMEPEHLWGNCYLDGFLAPRCLKLLRQRQSSAAATAPAQTKRDKSREGLERF